MPSISTWAESQSGQTDERVKITVNFTVSQNASANTSTITIGKIECYYNYDYYTGKSFYIDGTITVNGTRVFKSNHKTPQATVSATSFETHTISGGERNNTITVAHDSSGKATLTFVFANYSSNCSGFGGVNGSYSNYQFFVRDSSDKTKTYTLPTISQSVKVSYNANGGTGSTASQTTTKNTAITLRDNGFTPPTSKVWTLTLNGNGGNNGSPTFKNNYFNKWRAGSTSGTAYAAGASYTPTANITMYAWWGTNYVWGSTTRSDTTANGFKVTFNANSGTCSTGSLTAINTTKYEFLGWGSSADATTAKWNSTSTIGQTSAYTAYAVWKPTTTNGSITLPTPSRTNYTFKGWYTAASGGTKVGNAGASYTPTEATTLYAQWTLNQVTLTLTKGTGIASTTIDGTAATSKSITPNTSVTIGATLSEGYHWVNWTTGTTTTQFSADQTYKFTITAAATYKANAAINTYSIKYNANGGSGSMSNSSHTYGVAKNLTANAFTRAGYTFAGWNTNSSGTGTNYTNQQSVTNLSSTHGATVNLYAKWTPITYTVQYNANGGSGTTSSSSHTYGTAKTLTANGFSKFGHTFKGWATSLDRANAGTVDYANQASVSNLTTTNGATVNLYAVWEIYTKVYIYTNKKDGTSKWVPVEKYTYTGG